VRRSAERSGAAFLEMQSMRELALRGLVWIIVVAAMVAFPGAHAQTYPERPIRLVVPFPAGGTTDIVARVVSQHVSRRLGQQMIVENRPGAGGNTGTELVKRAAPDGYTLSLCTIGTCAINSSIYPSTGYDVQKDFVPVVVIGGVVNVLAVNPQVAARTVKELAQLAKSKPDTLTYGSSGYGTSPHLSGELFKDMAGVEITHVPYKGSAPAIVDLRGGQIDMFFDNSPSILPHVKQGPLRALATTGAARSKALPSVPTMQEAGFAGFVIEPWWGVLAPAKTPPAVVARLNQAINAVLKDPAVVRRFEEVDLNIWGGPPERLATLIRTETAKWGKLVRDRNIKAE
jgi:tripartite-type tricarboxylate transporter receptor subunit TctC